MFQASRQVDYAIQLVNRLSSHSPENPLSLRVFSEESTISFLFLQKIARALKRAGLIDSNKGQKGGYWLSANPAEISLKDVVEAIDGPFGVVDCMKEDGHCDKVAHCKTRDVWSDINDSVVAQLEQTKVIPF